MKLPWKGWRKPGSSPGQARNFRLTLLEWSFLGVVGVGAIYLLVLVAGVGRGPQKVPAQAQALVQRVKQLEVAHEHLATEVEQLKQLPPIPKGTKGSRAQALTIARLSRRVKKVETQLKNLSTQLASISRELAQLKASVSRGPVHRVSAPVPQPEQLHELRTRLAQLEQAVRRLRASRPTPHSSGARAGGVRRVVYQVRRGDTLYRIARRFRVTVGEIKQWNPKLTRRRVLYVGEKLVIYAYGAPSR